MNPIELFKFIPKDTQKYVFEFFKRSRKGCLIGKQLYKLEAPNNNIEPNDNMNMSMAFGEDGEDME